MKHKNDILFKIKQIIYKSVPDAEIILYGSRARNKSKKMSDWDLLILLNSTNISFDLETKLMDDLYEIEIDTGEIISPLFYTKNDWNENHFITPLYENIKKDGIRI
ncbi:MAG: DNA polymerase III subunit beta [Bacteroidetes bacterium RIFOXYA12_FULL_35_11]|nr:MAG: DNA polymerase III subunit beta [Bacteroidetes bacterium GWF2_35_48]OFY73378.1 MAG: DNA polymerase III subunit beta [Bacteroidetes bacterium RIFOXYA12_FULL_35_11]OFZ00177.1 MAG: DNA polymerase III subunit beta [Bacteroidetes bacterium RIFOXYC12_FULL_35_7]HBX53608.1 nucleotidyltransferase domain-containing protein [Bacteroidales bacterium]